MSEKDQLKNASACLYITACEVIQAYPDPRAHLRRGYKDEKVEWNPWAELLREYRDMEASCESSHPEWGSLFRALISGEAPAERPDVFTIQSFAAFFPLLAFLGTCYPHIAVLLAISEITEPFAIQQRAQIGIRAALRIDEYTDAEVACALSHPACVDLLNSLSVRYLSEVPKIQSVLKEYTKKYPGSLPTSCRDALVRLVSLAVESNVPFSGAAFEILSILELSHAELSDSQKEVFLSLGDYNYNCTYLLTRDTESSFSMWRCSLEKIELLLRLGCMRAAAILLSDYDFENPDAHPYIMCLMDDLGDVRPLCYTYMSPVTQKTLEQIGKFVGIGLCQRGLFEWLYSDFLHSRLREDPSILARVGESVHYLVDVLDVDFCEDVIARWAVSTLSDEKYKKLAKYLVGLFLDEDRLIMTRYLEEARLQELERLES